MTKNTKTKWFRGFELAKELGIGVRDIYRMFEAGELQDNGKVGMRRRFEYEVNEQKEEKEVVVEKKVEVKKK